MKLLKLMVHSIPGGAGFALLLAFLVFYLNPELPLAAPALWHIWAPLAALYGALAALAWPLGLLAVRFFAARELSLSWFSFPVFHRFHLINLGAAMVIWWANFLATPALLPPAAHRLLLAGCGLITLVWILGVLVSVQRVVFKDAWVPRFQTAMLAALYAGLYVLAAGEGGPRPAPGPPPRLGETRAEQRLQIIAIDGLSPDLILPLVAEGRLPTFQRMMQEGAWAPVQGFVPTLPPAVWTSVATGVRPGRHGIRDYVRFDAGSDRTFGLAPRYLLLRRAADAGMFRTSPVRSSDREAPAIWDILPRFGLEVGVVGWWATSPPESAGIVPPDAIPADAPGLADELARLAEWESAEGEDAPALRDTARDALAGDLAALEAARRLREARDLPLLLVYLPGLDAVQHRFFGHAFAPMPWGGPGEPHAVYGDVVARYYRFLDDRLAALLDEGAGDGLVIVVSGFGVDRVPPWTVLFRGLLGLPGGEGYHDRAPAGVLLAWGEGAAAGVERPPARPLDLLPTALYYLGLPGARDLEEPRIDLFTDEFTRTRPKVFFPTYDGAPG